MIRRDRLGLAGPLILTLLLIPVAWSRGLPLQAPAASAQPAERGSQVTVPSRPANPLYTGEQGKQRSEIEFIPSSRTVTVKVLVEDPNGYFIPNLRRTVRFWAEREEAERAAWSAPGVTSVDNRITMSYY